MSKARLSRLLTAWSVMLAIVFGALAPTLVHALPSDRLSGIEVEVCGSTGMFMLAIEAISADTDSDGYAAPQDQSEHCPWCCLHAGMAGPVQVVVMPLLPSVQEMPAAFYRAGIVSHVWRTALARAPPLA